MVFESEVDDGKRRWVRWTQFGTRTLLLLLTIAAVWLGLETDRGRRQERAVARIHAGGSNNVFYDFEDGEPSYPAWVRRLLGKGLGARVTRVDAMFCDLTDEDMDDFSALNHAKELWLWTNPITNDGLARIRLSTFRHLESLNLNETRVIDSGLVYLRELHQLQELYLSETQVTDVGLREIEHLTNLTVLHLEKTKITDAGIHHLERLVRLKSLNLLDTEISSEGGQRLQKMLPNCSVYWGEFNSE